MDLLLRLLERRVFLSIVFGTLAFWAVSRYRGYARGRADIMMYPPAGAVPSPLAADLVKDNEKRESAKLRGLHRAVSAEIAAAAAAGHKVDKLQRVADMALSLDTPAYRKKAMERLNRLRLAIPVRKETFRPASAEDLNPDAFERTRPKGRAARR